MLKKSIIAVSLIVFMAMASGMGLADEGVAVAPDKDKAIEVAINEAQAAAPDTEAKTGDLYRKKLREIVSEEKEEEFANEVDTYIRYMPRVKTKDGSGKVGITEAASEYSYAFKAFGKLPIEFSVDTRYIGINKTVGLSLPNSLTELVTGIEVTLPLLNINKTYLRLQVSPSWHGDNWNFNPGAFRMPVNTFAIYQPDDKWTFILGVAVRPDYENKVLPIAGFIYKPNDKLLFNIIPARPSISYTLNDKITVFMEGDISGDEFQVTKDDKTNAILQYNEFHMGGGVKYTFNKYIDASVSAGGILGRSLNYRDSLGKASIKNGMYTEFRIEARI